MLPFWFAAPCATVFFWLSLTISTSAADLVPVEQLGLRVARGFRVTLYADSDLANDIYAMTLDSRGNAVEMAELTRPLCSLRLNPAAWACALTALIFIFAAMGSFPVTWMRMAMAKPMAARNICCRWISPSMAAMRCAKGLMAGGM